MSVTKDVTKQYERSLEFPTVRMVVVTSGGGVLSVDVIVLVLSPRHLKPKARQHF